MAGAATRFRLVLALVLPLGLVALGAAGLAMSSAHKAKEAPAVEAPRVDRQGDPLPAGAVARLGTTRFRHGMVAVRDVAFLPDGKTLMSRGGYGEEVVRFWEFATGRELTSVAVGPGLDVPARLSPDGKLLAAPGAGGIVRLWDVRSGKLVRQLQHRHGAGRPTGKEVPRVACCFSGDGRLLASASPDGASVQLWEVAGGRAVRRLGVRGPQEQVQEVWLSADGKALVSVDGRNRVALWAVAAGRKVAAFETAPWTVAFSPDGRTVACVASNRRSVELREVATGKARHALAHPADVSCLAFVPDGKGLATGDQGGRVRFWDVGSGKQAAALPGQRWGASQLAFSRDGRVLAVASSGDPAHEWVLVWDVRAGKEVRRFRMEEQGLGFRCALSADGKLLAVATAFSTVRLWETATGRELHAGMAHQGPVGAVAFSPDGRRVATAGMDGALFLWDARTGKGLTRQEAGRVRRLAFSPGGRALACVGQDNTATLREGSAGGELRRLQLAEGAVGLAVAPNGRTGAWAWPDGTVRVLALPDGRELARLRSSEGKVRASTDVRAVFSPDGKRLAVLCPGTEAVVRVWEVDGGRALPRIARAVGRINVLAFAPDGRVLVTAGWPDGVVQLWEVASGRECLRLTNPEKLLTALAFSPAGRSLAVGANEGTIRLWALPTGRARGRLRGHRGGVAAMAFAPDGRGLVSGSWDTAALVWQTADEKLAPGALGQAGLARAWADLAAEDAGRAYRAAWALAEAPQEAVPFLRARLRPVEPADAKQVRRWIAELDSEEYRTRQQATIELERLGGQAEVLLSEALKGKPSLEAHRRLERILRKLQGAPAPEELRQARAVQVLEMAGSADAKAVLQALARGAAGARLTREAAAALARPARTSGARPR